MITQEATFFAALVSAAGSVTAAIVSYFRYRRETERPVVTISWNSDVVRLIVRNRAVAERTVHAIGWQARMPFGVRGQVLEFLKPELFGPELPISVAVGQYARWEIPYGTVREALDQCSAIERINFSAMADLGDREYVTKLPRTPYKLAKGAKTRKSRRTYVASDRLD